jgi:hypothetical protein
MTASAASQVRDVYPNNAAHLRAELDRLDLLIRIHLADGRQREKHPEARIARAMVISPDEVVRLLDTPPPAEEPPDLTADLHACTETIRRRVEGSLDDGVPLTLPRLGWLFGLSDLELQAVVICLAPELRRRYDRIYAYLQDDITRQRPSADLILDLVCADEEDRWTSRGSLAARGRLRQAGILEAAADPQSPSGSSGLGEFLRLDPRILDHLLGASRLDQRLYGVARLLPPAEAEPDLDPDLVAEVMSLLQARLGSDSPQRRTTVLHVTGAAAARELAGHVCTQLGVPLLRVDAGMLATAPDAALLLRLALREGLLLQCAVHVEHVQSLGTPAVRPLLGALAEAVADFGWLLITSGDGPWPDQDLLDDDLLTTVVIPPPSVEVRARAWRRALTGEVPDPDDLAQLLASRYRLEPAQIRAAVHTARMHRLMRPGHPALTLPALTAACRDGSRHRLGELAVKVDTRYGWDDLVLPTDRIGVLQEICAQIRHQHTVYDAWGFGRRLVHGTGLAVLFSGPSGTGKTLAASVLARDVGLDLYRVDLAQVVSKYIGETEKNLAAVFDEARVGNAILFFDEADALFGKRSAVTDAHDRYANIEISYLLQRMDDHEGVVVLATNLRQNMDDAFTRRIRFLVNFPFPDAGLRERIWRRHFPPQTPVSPDVDYAWLAANVHVAGGSIKNIVLNAAFRAADDDSAVTPGHLLHGIRREFDKVGKVWSEPR